MASLKCEWKKKVMETQGMKAQEEMYGCFDSLPVSLCSSRTLSLYSAPVDHDSIVGTKG
jgi:hypothetical protein